MDSYGFELYAGDWANIRDSCRASALDELRAGRVSEMHILFPPEFGAGDILFLQDAVAELAELPAVHIDFERDEPHGGMFVDRLIPAWTHSVASLSISNGPILMERWSARYCTEEERAPDWHEHVGGSFGGRLIQLCRLAQERNLDVVMVWFL
jgi:hypothetical protein